MTYVTRAARPSALHVENTCLIASIVKQVRMQGLLVWDILLGRVQGNGKVEVNGFLSENVFMVLGLTPVSQSRFHRTKTALSTKIK